MSKKLVFLSLFIPTLALAQAVKKTTEDKEPMTKELKDKFAQCHKETGVKFVNFQAGEKPSEADMLKMKKCLEKKGVLEPSSKKQK